jgi:hypothetical protein
LSNTKITDGCSEWKKRYDAITAISEIVYSFPEEFVAGDSGNMRVIRLFDVMHERLRDSNSKVHLLAVQTLKEWIPIMRVRITFIFSNR